MGPISKGGRRAAAASVLLSLLVLAPFVADAQIGPDVAGLEEAEEAKVEADRLVSAAVANRNQVEAELLATLERYQSLSFELSSVSARLARLSQHVATAREGLDAARESADRHGVEAYMQAVSMPGGLVWSSETIEEVMVAGRTLAILAEEYGDQAAVLAVTDRDLLALDREYQAEFRHVETLASQVETEAAALQQQFTLADRGVALAIGEALSADAAYRSELDQVEQARAAQEESERQAERATTTTALVATSSTSPTTTAAVATTATAGPNPTAPTSTAAVTTTAAGSISRTLKPAVEQWRPLVSSYFSPALVDQALSIIQCESLGDANAYNPYSGASGLFQFLPGTWAVTSVKAGFSGASVFDPEANIASAAWLTSYYQASGRSAWTAWHCVP